MLPKLSHWLAGAALAAGTAASQAAVVYSLANDGSTLIRFDTSNPGQVTTVGAIGGATSTLNGIDFRPADGLLYGFNQQTSGIYRVDTSTGATTLVSTAAVTVNTPSMGIDFNPVPDRLRVVSASNQNLRINITTGATIEDKPLAYAAGDAFFGADPSIVDAAYTNHDRDPATGTRLYYLDSALDTLVSTASPNDGVLNTIGSLGVDASDYLGFDIFTEGGVNTAFALLSTGFAGSLQTIAAAAAGTPGLYQVDLATGAATLIGAVDGQNVFGLAVAPAAAVSAPSPLALLSIAGLAAFGLRRRVNGSTSARCR